MKIFAARNVAVFTVRPGTFEFNHTGMALEKVKAYCGDRLCLLGNIDCAELLPRGTPEQVREAVRQAIAAAGKGGGLIISSSNSLHPDVDPDNCIAMFQATAEFGAYDPH